MKNVFALMLFSMAMFAVAQQKPGSLGEKAYQFSISSNTDSALYYYKILENDFPDCQSDYIKSRIGYCYYNLGDFQNAEKYFLQCLSLYESRNLGWLEVSQIAHALHQIYYRTGEFDKALFYLLSTRTTYKPKMRNCMGGFGFFSEMKFAYDQALCYQGLKLTDSIVYILAPWVFKPTSFEWMIDSSTYRFASELFVASACKLYGKQNLQCLLQNAIENTSYDIRHEKGISNYQMTLVDCKLKFVNTEIPLTSGGIGLRPGENLPSYLEKDFLIEEAKKSYTYKLIMAENRITHSDSHSL